MSTTELAGAPLSTEHTMEQITTTSIKAKLHNSESVTDSTPKAVGAENNTPPEK